jgi:branched-chain amino acid transport system permease protein
MRVTRQQITVGVLLVCSAVLPPFLNRALPDLFTDFTALIVGAGACYAAMAISLNVLMGYTGQISLGHGAFLAAGAFTSGIITGPDRLGLPFFVGLLVAGVVGGVAALLLGFPALRLRGLYLAIATIAFTFTLEQSVFRVQAITRGSAGLELPRPLAGTFLFNRNADYLAIVLVVLVLLWVLDANIVRTKLGRAFQGIREDEAVAQSFGVDVRRHKLLAFVISGAMAGIAGALYSHLIGFVNSESYPYQFSLLLVVMVVIGGLGHRKEVAIAAAVYAVIPRLLQEIEGWDLVIGSALLVYAMARHPGGFVQLVHEAKDRREAKRARDGKDEIEEEGALPKLPDMPRPTSLPPRPQVSADVPVLEVRDVSVRFGGLQAVDRASLVVPRNRIIGLIGPNGAGKTTLFNAISGFVRPETGSVKLLGQEISGLGPHERAQLGIGRTFQLIGLAKNLSVLENFLLAQHAVAGYGVGSALGFLPKAGRVEAELVDRAKEAIAGLGFERFTDTPVRNLSHGQQRIVELGCVLVTAPELVMLDEPSAGMSPGAAENLAVRLRDLRDELGRTVLLIEHNIPLVLDVCDEVYVLNFGQVLASGPTAEVAQRPEVVEAYFGRTIEQMTEASA